MTKSAQKSKNQSSAVKITGPTVLTIIRMIISVLFFIVLLVPTLPTRILALILFVVGAISDLIDGKWARKHQKVTDLGAFLDPLADKMLTSLAFLALVDMQIIPIGVFAAILVRDFAVDGMRMMVARKGVTIAASPWGKWKTTFQLTAIIILLANLIFGWLPLTILGNIALYISLALTIISGTDYLIKGWHHLAKK